MWGALFERASVVSVFSHNRIKEGASPCIHSRGVKTGAFAETSAGAGIVSVFPQPYQKGSPGMKPNQESG